MSQSDIAQLTEQAEKSLLAGDLASTEDILSKVLHNDDKNVDGWLLKAKLNLKKNNIPQAAVAFKEVLRLKPDTEEAVINLLNYHGIKKEYQECESILRNAIEKDPTFARYPFMLAKLFLEKGLHGEAIKHMERARKISPNNLRIIISLSEIYGKHGNLEMSLDIIQPLLEANPPYFPAVMVFSNLSPALNMVEDCKILIDKLTRLALRPEQTAELDGCKKMLIKTGI